MNSKSSNIIEISNLNKSFTQGKETLDILKNVNLEVASGDIVSLIGQSGCGKSTLVQIIGGLMGYNSGLVKIAGNDLGKLNDKEKTNLRRDKVGFIYQQHHLLSDFSALENVELSYKIGKKDAKRSRQGSIELLERLGLKDRIHHRPAELSGGQQQRVAIARAFANEPSLILADEPTGNLDEQNSKIVTDLFLEVAKENGTTLVIATHDKEISRKTKLIYEISSGNIHLVR